MVVERFVSSSEPAMIGNVSERPPRKKPSELWASSLRVKNQVRPEARAVNSRNEMIVIWSCRFWGFTSPLPALAESEDDAYRVGIKLKMKNGFSMGFMMFFRPQ